jgi:hypothetical protein
MMEVRDKEIRERHLAGECPREISLALNISKAAIVKRLYLMRWRPHRDPEKKKNVAWVDRDSNGTIISDSKIAEIYAAFGNYKSLTMKP